MNITVIDPVWSHCDEPNLIKPLLGFEKEFWKKSGFRKTRNEYTKYLINKKGIFLTGFISKIEKEFKDVEVTRTFQHPLYNVNPQLEGISLREDQLKLILAAVSQGRGILIAPTGSGKTVIAAGIISCYKEVKTLFLCHTITLVKQTIDEFNKFNIGKVTQVAEGTKDLSGNVVVATIQSFSNLPPEERDVFDVIIVDECHHLSGEETVYYKTLITMTAPIRIGVTATLPTKKESLLIMEGLLGEVLAETTLAEGVEKDFLSVPSVKLIKVPYTSNVRDLKTYNDIYDEIIVNSRSRNRLIINEIKKLNEQGLSTLTYVTKIEQGNNLIAMAGTNDLPITFIQGSTDGEDREYLRNALHEKTIMNIIATCIWKEGVNIKSLNAILIAGGGKSEIALLQTIGRGLRRDTDKDTVLIVDFVDTARYLSQHFCERLSIYLEKGWEIFNNK